MPLATRLVFAAVFLCVSGCKRFGSAELDGAVFVRMVSGETRPQGGIEVLLVSPEVKKEMASIESTFQKRVAERKQVAAAYRNQGETLRGELRKWREQIAAEIPIRILSARPDLENGWLNLVLAVSNNTQFRLTTVLYELFCGDRRIPTIGERSMLLLSTFLKQPRYLGPGQTYRTDSWGEAYFFWRTRSVTQMKGKPYLLARLKH